jgi:hypothetical protein
MSDVKAVAWLVNDSAFTSESEAVEEIKTWGSSGSIAEPLVKQSEHESALAALRDEVTDLQAVIRVWRGCYEEAESRAARLEAENARLRGLLFGVHTYGADTLSGPSKGPDDRKWYRDGVLEMTKRAALAEKEG